MNNKISTLILSLAAFSSTTLADTAVSPSASSKLTYDWTGVYVGGFIGGATGSDVSNSEARYDDGQLWNDPGDLDNNYSTKAGFIGGGTVGYNWQIGKTPYLVGLEGEYGYLSQQNSKTDPNAAIFNTYHPTEIKDNAQSGTSIGADYGYGLVGGRLGYALDRSLIYIKSGAVFTSVASSWSDTAYKHYGQTNQRTTTGYALGAGLEYAMPFKYFTNVSVKAEYLYFGIPTSTDIGEASTGYYGGHTGGITQTTGDIHTAKIGVNYRF